MPRILALCIFLFACPSALAQAPYWGQEQADAARGSWVSLPGVQSQPQPLWTAEFEAIVAGPYNWGDFLYLIEQRGRKAYLVEVDVSTGDVIDDQLIRADGPFWLGVHEGRIVVVANERVGTYVRDKNKIKVRKVQTFKGANFDPVGVLFEGHVAVRDGENQLRVLDLEFLKEQASGTMAGTGLSWAEGQFASAEYRDRSGNVIITPWTAPFALGDSKFRGTSSGSISMRLVEPSDGWYPAPVYCASKNILGVGHWWHAVPTKVKRGNAAGFHSLVSQHKSVAQLAFRDPPVVLESGDLLGTSNDGSLYRGSASDEEWPILMQAPDRPEGSGFGPLALAGDVLYLHNWAYNVATGEVLWVMPDLNPEGPLLPLPGRRFLARVKEHKIEVYGESAEPEQIAMEGGASRAAALAESFRDVPATRPGSGPGLVLVGGVRLAGELGTLRDGMQEVIGEKETWQVPMDAVAVVERAEGLQSGAGLEALVQAWRRYQLRMRSEGLDEAVQEFNRIKMPGECRRLLEEGQRIGARPELIESWQRAASRVVKTDNRGKNYGSRAREREAKMRLAWLAEAQETLEWAAHHELWGLAAALLLDAEDYGIAPEQMGEFGNGVMDPQAPTWMRGNSRLWAEWAIEMPSFNARFLDREDSRWERWKGSLWEHAAVIETENLLFLSTSKDAALMSRCARNAELVVRVLNDLFSIEADAEREKLEVRVFRDQYQFENAPETNADGVPKWAAGYYSPMDQVSRFYVPETESALGEGRAGLVLNEVMVHEITHHFIAQRWLSSKGAVAGPATKPGYWIVEGFATFVENQALGVLNRGHGLDDQRVLNLDVMAQIAKLQAEANQGRVLFALDQFLDASAVSFHSIPDQVVAETALRQRSGLAQISAINLFYEQAGAMVYFLMHESDKSDSKRVLDYMRSFYEGKSRPQAWTYFGYESAEELDAAFLAFLAKVDREW